MNNSIPLSCSPVPLESAFSLPLFMDSLHSNFNSNTDLQAIAAIIEEEETESATAAAAAGVKSNAVKHETSSKIDKKKLRSNKPYEQTQQNKILMKNRQMSRQSKSKSKQETILNHLPNDQKSFADDINGMSIENESNSDAKQIRLNDNLNSIIDNSNSTSTSAASAADSSDSNAAAATAGEATLFMSMWKLK